MTLGTGTTPQPNLSISPSSFDFGETQAGSTSAIKTFTVTNNGNATATGCAASLSSNAHFTITSPTGSFNVAAGASVSVKVTFNPQSAGSKTANLQIGYPGGTTLTSSLEGYGYQPQLTFSLTTWNAGSINVGQSVGPQSILLTNTGSGNAKGSVSLQNGTNFSIASGGGDFDLNANASKTITVIFQPQSSGEHSDYLNAKSLTNSIIDDVQLLGTGTTPQPNLSISPSSFDFGETQAGSTSAIKTFTVTNNGNATATGCAASLSSNAHFTITSPTGSFNVAAGASVSVKVTFNPQSAGEKSATLQVGYPGITALTSSLTGFSYQPELSFSTTSWNAGSATIGQSVGPQSILLTNTGSGNAKGSVSLQNGTNFSIASGGGDFDLNANASKTITVIFQPQSSGEHSEYLNALSLTSSIIDNVELLGTGVGTLPNLSFNPSHLEFNPVVLGENPITQIINVTNLSSTPANGCIANLIDGTHFTILSPMELFTVNGNSSFPIVVEFNPQIIGNLTDVLQVMHGGISLGSNLSGVGLPPDINYLIEMQSFRISDNTGTLNTNNPGIEKNSFLPGEAVRITFSAQNTGEPVDVQCALNIFDSNGEVVYDSHLLGINNTFNNPLGSTINYYSFDWQIPNDAAFGSYDIGASIRSLDNFNLTYETTCPGPNTDFDCPWILEDKFTIFNSINPPIEIPILMYHNVDEIAHSQYWLAVTDFSQQMEYLDAYGYNPVSLFQVINYCNNGTPLPSNPVVLTFDDGYLNFYTKAYPILQSHGFKATNFLITDFVGTNTSDRQSNTWEPDPFELSLNNQHLVWSEVHQMAQSGLVSFQSHSKTHPLLTNLDQNQLNSELITSKNTMSSQMGSCDFFSFPFGGVNTNVENAVIVNGYHAALDIDRGNGLFNTTTSNRFRMERLYIPSYMSLDEFAQKIDPDFQFPDLEILSVQFYDENNNLKTEFSPGETIITKVQFKNNGPTVTTTISLNLHSDNTDNTPPTYDSHLQVPSEDITVTINTGQQMDIEYEWIIPENPVFGQWYYYVGFHCEHYLLWFGGSYWQEGFEVIEEGISLEDLFGQPTELYWYPGIQMFTNHFTMVKFVKNDGSYIWLPFEGEFNSTPSFEELVDDPVLAQALYNTWLFYTTAFSTYDVDYIIPYRNHYDLSRWWDGNGIDVAFNLFSQSKRKSDRTRIGSLSFTLANEVLKAKVTGSVAAGLLFNGVTKGLMDWHNYGKLDGLNEQDLQYLLIAYTVYGGELGIFEQLGVVNEDLLLAVNLVRNLDNLLDQAEVATQLVAATAFAATGATELALNSLGNAALNTADLLSGIIYDNAANAIATSTGLSELKEQIKVYSWLHDAYHEAIFTVCEDLIGIREEIDSLSQLAYSPENARKLNNLSFEFAQKHGTIFNGLVTGFVRMQLNHTQHIRNTNLNFASNYVGASQPNLNSLIDDYEIVRAYYQDEMQQLIDFSTKSFGYYAMYEGALLTVKNIRGNKIRVSFPENSGGICFSGEQTPVMIRISNDYEQAITFDNFVVNTGTAHINIINNASNITIQPFASTEIEVIAAVANDWYNYQIHDKQQLRVTLNWQVDGETITNDYYLDLVVASNTNIIELTTDKSIYRPGETIEIVCDYAEANSGEVISLAAAMLKPDGISETTIYSTNPNNNKFYLSATLPNGPFGAWGTRNYLFGNGYLITPITYTNQTFYLVPEIDLNYLQSFDFDNFAIIYPQPDSIAAEDVRFLTELGFEHFYDIQSYPVEFLESIAQSMDVILLGGHLANPLSEQLTTTSLHQEGDAIINYFPNAFGNHNAIVIAGWSLRDTQIAAMGFVHQYQELNLEPPTAPILNNLTNFNNAIYIEWSPSIENNIIQYDLYRSNNQYTTQLLKTISIGGSTTYLDEFDLINGEEYYYKIKSKNQNGIESDFSNELSIFFQETVYPLIEINHNELVFENTYVEDCIFLQYELNGINLTNDIIVTTSSEFLVSTNETTGFTDLITIPHTNGSINQVIYVKFCPEVAQQYIGSISNASAGAETQTVSVSGTGINPPPSISVNPNNLLYGEVNINNCAALSYALTGNYLTDNLTITAPDGFQVSADEASGFGQSITVPHVDGAINQMIYVQFCPLLAEVYAGNILNVTAGSEHTLIPVSGTGTEVLVGSLVDELLLYWDFDQTSANLFQDKISSIALNMNIGASVSSNGVINNCVLNDGSLGSGLIFGEYNAFNVKALSFWIKPITLQNNKYLMHGNAANDQATVINYKRFGEKMYLQTRLGNGGYYQGNQVLLETGIWNHIVITENATDLTVYLNGVLVANQPGKNTWSNDKLDQLLRHVTNGYEVDAAFDEFGVWSRILNQSEISQLYNSGNGLQYPFSDQLLVTTTEPYDITATSAVSGGNIDAQGDTPITARGIVWSTSSEPSLELNSGFTMDGEGSGTFTSQLSGLLPATTYYIRAYATNSDGTVYGQQLNFTTLSEILPPVVTTAEISAITSTSAISGGNITDDGGSPVTARGVVWGTAENPDIVTNIGFTNDGEGIGAFTSQLSDLLPETTYYVKAYATTSIGTTYGDQLQFTTLAAPGSLGSGLISYWKFDEGSGISANDSKGASHWSLGSSIQQPIFESGKIDYGLVFDGNDFANTPSLPFNFLHDGSSDWSISLWANTFEGGGGVFGNTIGVDARGIYLTVSDSYVGFSIGRTSPYPCLQHGWNNVIPPNNQYNLITLTYSVSLNALKLYINGQYIEGDGSRSNDHQTGNSYYSNMELGRQKPHQTYGYFTGQVDETAIWDKVLTSDEIALLYNNGNGLQYPFSDQLLVITTEPYDITTSSAVSGGTIISTGEHPILGKGIVWDVNQSPSLVDNSGFTNEGSGSDSFMSYLTELSTSTTYFVRAYAITENDTVYGMEKTFTTLVECPNPFVTEFHNLDDNQAPAGWIFEAPSPVAEFSEGKLYARKVDATGLLKRQGCVPEETSTISMEWDGILQYTYWGMISYAEIHYGIDKYIIVGIQTAEASYGTEFSKVWFSKNNPAPGGQSIIIHSEMVPLVFSTFHYKVLISNDQLRLVVYDLNTGLNYVDIPVEIPESLEFSVDSLNCLTFKANCTTDNDIWIDNVAITVNPNELPEVETLTIEDITSTTAIGGGNVVHAGASDVLERGIVYSTIQNPSLTSNTGFTTDGSGLGAFSSQLTDLTPETTYYVRAYATNSNGTGYGQQRSFMSLNEAELPVIITNLVTGVTTTNAISGGEITNNGGSDIIARGVVWNTASLPTTDDNIGFTTDGAGMGVFTSELTGLIPQTTYYLRAYATNDNGTAYGEEKVFNTLSENGNNVVYYLSNESGTNNLWRAIYNETELLNPQQLSFYEDHFILEYAISTSTNKIAFNLFPVGGYRGDIYIADMDLNNPTLLPNQPAQKAGNGLTFSPDGSKIAFSLGGGSTGTDGDLIVATINIDGSDYQQIIPTTQPRGYVTHKQSLNWTTNGLLIGDTKQWSAYATMFEIFRYDFNSFTNLTNTAGIGERYPFVSDDGQKIVYGTAQNPGSSGIGMMNIDGSDQISLIPLSTLAYEPGGWIDNQTIIYHSNEGGTYNLWKMQSDGSNKVNLTNGSTYNFFRPKTFFLNSFSPVVVTSEVTDISADLAVCGGEVTNEGNTPVIARGIVWSTNQNPSLTSNTGYTTDGSGLGAFSSQLTDLSPETTYYVRAYATNGDGTGYGQQISFTTLSEILPPVISTAEISAITSTTAISGGNITDDGGSPVTARGVVWHTTENPDILTNIGYTTDGEGTGTFTSQLSDLLPETTYFVRAYATTNGETVYGQQISFTTLGEILPPVVTTAEISGITSTTAISGGNITNDGGSAVTARGVVWGIADNPDLTTNSGFTTDGNGTGVFTSSLQDLTPATTYYVRAYATNEAGTAYGSSIPFMTLEAICSPGWTPTPSMQFNMQIVAQIIRDDQVSLQASDVVGAFVGDECRGIGSPMPNDNGLIFLSVASNQSEGEEVELRIWSAEACEACEATPGFTFINNGALGTMLEPYEVSCNNNVELDLNFGQGFTWFSLNVNPGNMSLGSLFDPLSPCYDDRVIGQTSFALYTGSSWLGSLTTLGMQQSYRMKLCSQQNLTLIGEAAPLDPFNLSVGYSWLGFQPQECMSISAAMAGLSPGPSYDDRVIGQSSFALYTGANWLGSLTQLCPGAGYVIKLANAQTLTYPAANAKDSPVVNETLVSPTGIYPAAYQQHSMMVVAKLMSEDGMVSFNEKDVIYASINGAIRGMAQPMADNDGLIFLSIGSNEEVAQPISFMLWLDERQELLPLNESLSFEPLAAIGELNDPFIFTLGEMVGLDETADGIWIGEPYPNPFTERTTIPYFLNEATELRFSIYDSRGVQVRSAQSIAADKGHHQLSIESVGLARGVYVMKVFVVQENLKLVHFTKLIIN